MTFLGATGQVAPTCATPGGWRTTVQIQQINLGRRLAITSTNELIPIIAMMDEHGENTSIPGDAKSFLAGPTESGSWLQDEVRSFDFAKPTSIN